MDELHHGQKSLAHAVDTLANMDTSLNLLSGDNQFNLNQALSQVVTNLQNINGVDVSEILKMLEEVSINLNEVEAELQSKHDSIEINPEKLNQVESRLELIYQTARKHKVATESLYQHFIELSDKLSLNDSQKQNREKLLAAKTEIEQQYLSKSNQLSKARHLNAKQFSIKVSNVIQQLGLNKAQFIVSVQT